MNAAGNCADVPTYLQSIADCGGEYIGIDSGEDHFHDIVSGSCNNPSFTVSDVIYAGNRHVYIDEILNNFGFRRDVRRFIRDQDYGDNDNVLVINGYIDPNGAAT